MDRNIIELQRGSKGVAILVLDKEYQNIGHNVSFHADIKNINLFKNSLNELSKKHELCYLIIRDITKVNLSKQNEFISLVKDRELHGYNLPNNVIIVFTINNEKEIKEISKELYKFFVITL